MNDLTNFVKALEKTAIEFEKDSSKESANFLLAKLSKKANEVGLEVVGSKIFEILSAYMKDEVMAVTILTVLQKLANELNKTESVPAPPDLPMISMRPPAMQMPAPKKPLQASSIDVPIESATITPDPSMTQENTDVPTKPRRKKPRKSTKKPRTAPVSFNTPKPAGFSTKPSPSPVPTEDAPTPKAAPRRGADAPTVATGNHRPPTFGQNGNTSFEPGPTEQAPARRTVTPIKAVVEIDNTEEEPNHSPSTPKSPERVSVIDKPSGNNMLRLMVRTVAFGFLVGMILVALNFDSLKQLVLGKSEPVQTETIAVALETDVEDVAQADTDTDTEVAEIDTKATDIDTEIDTDTVEVDTEVVETDTESVVVDTEVAEIDTEATTTIEATTPLVDTPPQPEAEPTPTSTGDVVTCSHALSSNNLLWYNESLFEMRGVKCTSDKTYVLTGKNAGEPMRESCLKFTGNKRKASDWCPSLTRF